MRAGCSSNVQPCVSWRGGGEPAVYIIRMLISVIIPCYNASATIASTIDSALIQGADREIIVAFGDRIRAEYGPNRGASAARERGTQLARGELFQYLDSDDQLAPGTLARRLETMRQTGADAV